jgi:hypothetical protein
VVSEFLLHVNSNIAGNISGLVQKSSVNDLESAAHIAVIAASHINGFHGVQGWIFLEELMRQATPLSAGPLRSLVDSSHHLTSLMNELIIPYQGPDGLEWPQLLRELPGVFLGSYHRLTDRARKAAGVFDTIRLSDNCKMLTFLEQKNLDNLGFGDDDQHEILMKWSGEKEKTAEDDEDDVKMVGEDKFLHITACFSVTNFTRACHLKPYLRRRKLNLYVLQEFEAGEFEACCPFPEDELERPNGVSIILKLKIA